MSTCRWEYEISDADFGYWDDAWGEPSVHTFTCDEPATVILTVICPHGADEVPLCSEHSPRDQ